MKSTLAQMQCAGVLLEALPGLMRFVRKQMRSRRAKGLSVPQFRTLIQLRRRPAVSLSSVAESLGSSVPTMSRMVSGLVAKGLIVRREAPHDRRQVTLALTPRGEAVIDAAWSGTQSVLAERLAGLSEAQVAAVTRALGIVLELFPAGENDAGKRGAE